MAAAYEVREDIAVITLDNPPVNGLGFDTRRDLVEGVQRACEDEAIRAIVVTGAGKAFSGGTDTQEFNTPKALQEPILLSTIDRVEAASKPVIAAMHGVAMSGGLELAMGCHYRVASPDARLALPEVRLGLMPGAGGTQRLPRAIGVARSLAMILSGDAMPATDFADTPLIQALIEGDLVDGACDFARRVAMPAASEGRLPRLRDLAVETDGAALAIEQARAGIADTSPHLPAPARCIDAIEAATTDPFEQGLRRERESLLALLESPQSRALRQGLISEQAAGGVDGLPADVAAGPLDVIAFVGEGGHGLDLAQIAARAGCKVLWFNTAGAATDAAIAATDGASAGASAGASVGANAEATDTFDNLTHVTDLAALADADLVIVTSQPGMDPDLPLFEDLDELMKPEAILAADAATTDIDALAGFTQRPDKVVALHGCRSSLGLGVLEIGRGKHTDDRTVATAVAFANRIELPFVVCMGLNGMIGERMRRRYGRHVESLQDRGVPLARIVQALGAFGFDPPPLLPDMPPEAVAPDTGEIDDAKIVEYLMCGLVNEAAHLLHEGIAKRASDIDLVCLKGYGFPAHTGGPLFYAHERGLDCMVASLLEHGETCPIETHDWVPSPLLVRLASEGRRFD
jgi:3-hydroxyacyl-CoA dehydrogenase